MATFTLFSNVLIFVLLAVPGFILSKTDKIKTEDAEVLSNLLIYVGMPALVFSQLIKINICDLPLKNIIFCLGLPIVLTFVMIPVAKLVFKQSDCRKTPCVCQFCSIFANCGFLGIPLANAIFPQNPEVLVCLGLYNVISTFLLLSVGIIIISGSSKEVKLKKAFLGPITFAVVLGTICSGFGAVRALPQMAKYAEYLANLTTPLAMIVLGADLAKVSFSVFFKTKELYKTILLKLIVAPLIFILLFYIIKKAGIFLSETVIISSIIAASMGTAASAPAMSKKYGEESELATIITTGTNAWSVVTFPLMYILAKLFLSI